MYTLSDLTFEAILERLIKNPLINSGLNIKSLSNEQLLIYIILLLDDENQHQQLLINAACKGLPTPVQDLREKYPVQIRASNEGLQDLKEKLNG